MKFVRLVIFGLLLGLTACNTGPKIPVVFTPGSLDLNSSETTEFINITYQSTATSQLNWSVNKSTDRLSVTPSQGILQPGENQRLLVEYSYKGLATQSILEEEISIDFTEEEKQANALVTVRFEMDVGGFDACGERLSRSAFTRAPQTQQLSTLGEDLPYVPGELLVKYKVPLASMQKDSSRKLLNSLSRELARDYNLSFRKPADQNRPALVTLAEGEDVLAMAKRLERDPRIAYAEPNYRLNLHLKPNDEFFDEQWNMANFGLQEAWDIQQGNNEVIIAVIDSGVDTGHEDLRDKILPGCDFNMGDNNPNPGEPNGGRSEHGTHVAGIAAAVGNNFRGVAGVAYGPGVKILPVKVFDDPGINGSISDLVDALLWSAGIDVDGVNPNPNPADIINMSLGAGIEEIAALNEAAARVDQAGVVMFASSGNYATASGDAPSSQGIQAPANSPNILAVGSVDEDFTRSSFSDFGGLGGGVDLMAPGGSAGLSACGSVLSTYPGDEYNCLQGTSMSSPFAAGVAALLLSQTPSLSPDEVKAKLLESTVFDSSFMNAAEYGAGIICADKALGASSRCGVE